MEQAAFDRKSYRAADLDYRIAMCSVQAVRGDSYRSNLSCFLQGEEGRDPFGSGETGGLRRRSDQQMRRRNPLRTSQTFPRPMGGVSRTGLIRALIVGEITSGRKDVLGEGDGNERSS